MICQLAKVPLGELLCLSSWRRGLGTPRLSTQCPLLGARFPRVGAGLGGSRNSILHQLGTVSWVCRAPDCIRIANYDIVPDQNCPEPYCIRITTLQSKPILWQGEIFSTRSLKLPSLNMSCFPKSRPREKYNYYPLPDRTHKRFGKFLLLSNFGRQGEGVYQGPP